MVQYGTVPCNIIFSSENEKEEEKKKGQEGYHFL